MEGLQPLHRRVAGIDVHRMLHGVTVLIEQADGSIGRTTRQFGGRSGVRPQATQPPHTGNTCPTKHAAASLAR